MAAHKRVSSRDVAKEAGVSQATVSYVLNNREDVRITAETREAVLAAAKKLNYHANFIARSMRLKKALSIGVVSDKNMSNYLIMVIMEGIRKSLLAKSYSITFCTYQNDNFLESDYIRYYESGLIDGILFVFTNINDEVSRHMRERNIPFVSINSYISDAMEHQVRNDIEVGIHAAVRHLKSEGISQIGYISRETGRRFTTRLPYFLKALELEDIDVKDELICAQDVLDENINDFLNMYFTNSLPRAVICNTATLGFHTLRYLNSRGIRIPQEVSVVGIGTSDFSQLSSPTLSAVEAPLYSMGVRGCEMLFELMNGELRENVIVLDWGFVKRES